MKKPLVSYEQVQWALDQVPERELLREARNLRRPSTKIRTIMANCWYDKKMAGSLEMHGTKEGNIKFSI